MRLTSALLGPVVSMVVAFYGFGTGAALATHEDTRVHHLVIQVTENDPDVMSLALSNAVNVTQHFGELGEEVEIEFVAYGPGLHMLRDDTSPVKARLKSIRESLPGVVFTACGNTMTTMEKTEGKPIPLVPETNIVKAGVVRVMELQRLGWSYLRP
jgi:intracellular sulfur oxidation DsrE/DsrF family protein